MDIVQCGFVKDLSVNQQSGHVKFRLELTTPACPIKDEFERKAHSVVTALAWVTAVDVTMDAVPPRPIRSEEDRPQGLRSVAHVIAVSSCKGGMHHLHRLSCLLTCTVVQLVFMLSLSSLDLLEIANAPDTKCIGLFTKQQRAKIHPGYSVID